MVLVMGIVTIFALEISSGYYIYSNLFSGSPAILELAIRAKNSFPLFQNSQRQEDLNQPSEHYLTEPNPFVTYPERLDEEFPLVLRDYHFHPFFDFSGFRHKTEKVQLDYFGFRNETSEIYFAPKPENDFLIVMTGGSEAAGWTHERPIIERLEDILQNHPKFEGIPVRVLNLAMSSHTLPNEINAFVHLAFNLHPDIVISHTGWNDMMFGHSVPEPFKRLGLNYFAANVDWLPRLYALSTDSIISQWQYGDQDTEDVFIVVDSFLRNLEKYRTIAESSGALFISGIQGYNHAPPRDETHRKVHALERELERRIKDRHEYVDFLDMDGLEFADPIHTTEETAQIIAEVYAERILQNIEEGKIRR